MTSNDPQDGRQAGRRRPSTARRLAAAGALIGALAIAPGAAQATVVPRTADMDNGSLSAFDQLNQTTGTLSVDRTRAYEGAASAHARYAGGGQNGFARGIFNVGWKTGDDVSFGAAFYLPAGFKNAIQSETDLMRYDNYGASSTTDYGGIGLLRADRKAHLFRVDGYVSGSNGSGVENMSVAPAFDLPEGRWFWLEVHQKLSPKNGTAQNDVWIDGKKVSTSTTANTAGRGVTRVRYGIVAIGEGKQTNPLDLWFDRATISTKQIGPLTTATPRTAAKRRASSRRRHVRGVGH